MPSGKTLRGTFGVDGTSSWTHQHTGGIHSHPCSSTFGCSVSPAGAVPTSDATHPEQPGFTSISYGFQLASPPVTHIVSGATPAGRQGNASNPGADPGHLCVFVTASNANGTLGFFDSSRFGAVLSLDPASPRTGNLSFITGRWAVTSN
jgi:hypothetical protein